MITNTPTIMPPRHHDTTGQQGTRQGNRRGNAEAAAVALHGDAMGNSILRMAPPAALQTWHSSGS
jgi:hypothetical protein